MRVVNQVENVNDERHRIVNIRGARLLDRNPVLVDDIWLVDVKNLDVV